jgi:hypothetical protein
VKFLNDQDPSHPAARGPGNVKSLRSSINSNVKNIVREIDE